MNAISPSRDIGLVPLAAITRDPEVQPRADIDRQLLAEYADALVAGAQFPPVVCFRTAPNVLLLADGFHRWDAHKLTLQDRIAAEVRDGSREDAIRFALTANARHGARRKRGDFTKGYATALRLGMIKLTDSAAAVARLLECSADLAEQLHATAVASAKAARDAEIAAKAAEGKSTRQIASEIGGLDHSTVSRRIKASAVAKSDGREMQRPDPDPDDEPAPMDRAAVSALAEELGSEANKNWHEVSVALRHLNAALADLDGLFARHITAFDYIITPELNLAETALAEFARRYRDV